MTSELFDRKESGLHTLFCIEIHLIVRRDRVGSDTIPPNAKKLIIAFDRLADFFIGAKLAAPQLC
jgi:hypothetical protein